MKTIGLRWWYSFGTCRANTGNDHEGYAHWYCQHARWSRNDRAGHRHIHRYRNYVWPEGGSVRHDPIPLDMTWPRCDRVRPELQPRTPRPVSEETLKWQAEKAAYIAGGSV